jgi:hypothetical protein
MSGECESCGNHALECDCVCDNRKKNHIWIKVKERLPPEDGKRILAWGVPACGTCAAFDQIQLCLYSDGRFDFGEWECIFEATHWMPLPEAPNE